MTAKEMTPFSGSLTKVDISPPCLSGAFEPPLAQGLPLPCNEPVKIQVSELSPLLASLDLPPQEVPEVTISMMPSKIPGHEEVVVQPPSVHMLPPPPGTWWSHHDALAAQSPWLNFWPQSWDNWYYVEPAHEYSMPTEQSGLVSEMAVSSPPPGLHLEKSPATPELAESTDTGSGSGSNSEDESSAWGTSPVAMDGVKAGRELLALLNPETTEVLESAPLSPASGTLDIDDLLLMYIKGHDSREPSSNESKTEEPETLLPPPGLSPSDLLDRSGAITPPPGLDRSGAITPPPGLEIAEAMEATAWIQTSPSSGCDADVSSDELDKQTEELADCEAMNEEKTSSAGEIIDVSDETTAVEAPEADLVPSDEPCVARPVVDFVPIIKPAPQLETETLPKVKPSAPQKARVNKLQAKARNEKTKQRSKAVEQIPRDSVGSKVCSESTQLDKEQYKICKKVTTDATEQRRPSLVGDLILLLSVVGLFTLVLIVLVYLRPTRLDASAAYQNTVSPGVSHALAVVAPAGASLHAQQQTISSLARNMDIEFARARAVASYLTTKLKDLRQAIKARRQQKAGQREQRRMQMMHMLQVEQEHLQHDVHLA